MILGDFGEGTEIEVIVDGEPFVAYNECRNVHYQFAELAMNTKGEKKINLVITECYQFD